MTTLPMLGMTDIVVDSYGNKCRTMRMPGSGFCGFHCLAFSLTGTPWSYVDIIDDCINVFTNIPELFRLRTNFGSHCNSSLTVNNYASFMRHAVRQVQAGKALHSDAWAEDAHFAALSLLYDVAVFTHSTQTRQWHVFNESGTQGYVCLLSVPGHFDVLAGVTGPPVIPVAAHTHGIRCDNYNASDEVWKCLQRNYSLEFVFRFPEQFVGVQILNRPVVVSEATAKPHTILSERPVELKQKTAYKCDFLGCSYVSDKVQSVTMHKHRCHSHHKVAECDFPSCSYVCDKPSAVAIVKAIRHSNPESQEVTSHNRKCHSQKKWFMSVTFLVAVMSVTKLTLLQCTNVDVIAIVNLRKCHHYTRENMICRRVRGVLNVKSCTTTMIIGLSGVK